MASTVCCYTLMTPAGRMEQQHGFPALLHLQSFPLNQSVRLISLKQSEAGMLLPFSLGVSSFSRI